MSEAGGRDVSASARTQGKWVYNFLAALFGGTDAIAAFSKPNHKWDTPATKKTA